MLKNAKPTAASATVSSRYAPVFATTSPTPSVVRLNPL